MLIGRLIVDDLASSSGVNVGPGSSGAASGLVATAGSSDLAPSMGTDLNWKSPLQRLLSPELKMTSLLLWFIWTACAFCYYGMVLMSTELLANAASAEDEGACLNRDSGSAAGNGNVSPVHIFQRFSAYQWLGWFWVKQRKQLMRSRNQRPTKVEDYASFRC